MNALANPEVGKYIDEHFCSSFQKVATFKIVETPNGQKQKQGGNVAAYFCAPDGRVLHVVAGPVNAPQMLKEAKWVVATATQAVKDAKGDGAAFKAIMRKAHAEKLRTEHGLVVQPVTYDVAVDQDPNSALTYRDPTGRPLAPVLKPTPIDGPDVKFKVMQERAAVSLGAAPIADRSGRRLVLGNQGRVHTLMAAHCMVPIETIFGSVFEGILGERISTRPVEVVHPFPWHARAQNQNGK